MSHTIETRFVSKDPEWELTYSEIEGGVTRNVKVAIYVDEMQVGSLNRWEDGAAMSPADRKRVLDRLADWAFRDASGPRDIKAINSGNEPVRLPGEHLIEPHFNRNAGAWFRERGRSTFIRGHELRRKMQNRVRVYLDRFSRWTPGTEQAPDGEIVTDEQRERIGAALKAWTDPEEESIIEVAPTFGIGGIWELAVDLEEWSESMCVLAPTADLIGMVSDKEMPPPAGWFWRLEWPIAYVPGRTGRNIWPPHGFSIGPISWDSCDAARELLRWEKTPPRKTWVEDPATVSRELLAQWGERRAKGESPPAELAGRVQGMVMSRPELRGKPELAAYADGSVRFVSSTIIVVYEPGVNKEIEAAAAKALVIAQELSDRGAMGESALTALTCAGPRAIAASPEVVAACDALLFELVKATAPVGGW